jgi:hypothetical protein
MRKLFLGVLVAVMMFVMIGSVSATSGVYFTNPSDNSYIKGSVNVEWENNGTPDLNLQYALGTCTSPGTWNDLAGSMPTSQKNYSWNTVGVSDGNVCLRLQIGTTTYDSRDLTVDNTLPVINNFVVNQDGTENDTKSIVYLSVTESNLDSCKIDWADGSTKNCTAADINKAYSHQYGDNKAGGYNVVVTVTDRAGNSATKSVNVNPVNVAPTITKGIDAPDNLDVDGNGLKEAAVGESVKFNASGTDVSADLSAGLTCVWKFDGSTIVSKTADSSGKCEVEYTWTSAGTHTVDLTVKDKDGGSSAPAAQYKIEVAAPEHMTPMQQVVQDNVFKFNLDEPWRVESGNNKQFKTSLSGPLTCKGIVYPAGMSVTNDGDGKCKVIWTPDNSERGVHSVIIKANNSANYKYYSFDVTVYSWGIHLVPGWNLISIPYVPTNSSIDKVFADILPNVAYIDSNTATVLQYDAVTNKWYRARPTSTHSGFTWSSSTYKLNNVVPGYGYWVKMDNEDWIYGIEENFNPSQGQMPVPSVSLAGASWNLIGRYGTNPVLMTNLTKAFETLEGYWFEDGFLKFDGVNSFKKATSIDVGNGYWLRTKILPDGKSTIAYEPLSYYFD